VSGGQLGVGVLDVAEDQGALRLEQGHWGAWCVPGHPDHAVTDLQGRLERRDDPIGAVDVAADEVLQPVVAVETAASLPSCTSQGLTCAAGAWMVIAFVVMSSACVADQLASRRRPSSMRPVGSLSSPKASDWSSPAAARSS
jgi:hypothetical protein